MERRRVLMCKHPKQIICGEEVCSTCYEKELLSTRDAAKLTPIEIAWEETKHMRVARKKR